MNCGALWIDEQGKADTVAIQRLAKGRAVRITINGHSTQVGRSGLEEIVVAEGYLCPGQVSGVRLFVASKLRVPVLINTTTDMNGWVKASSWKHCRRQVATEDGMCLGDTDVFWESDGSDDTGSSGAITAPTTQSSGGSGDSAGPTTDPTTQPSGDGGSDGASSGDVGSGDISSSDDGDLVD